MQHTPQWGPNFCLGHCCSINYSNSESQVCFVWSWTITKTKHVDYKPGRSLLTPNNGVSCFSQRQNNSLYFSLLKQRSRFPVEKPRGSSPRFYLVSWTQIWEVPSRHLYTFLLVYLEESHPPRTPKHHLLLDPPAARAFLCPRLRPPGRVPWQVHIHPASFFRELLTPNGGFMIPSYFHCASRYDWNFCWFYEPCLQGN